MLTERNKKQNWRAAIRDLGQTWPETKVSSVVGAQETYRRVGKCSHPPPEISKPSM